MAFVTGSVTDLPKRVGRPRTFNEDEAKAGLAIISEAGKTVSDGVTYDEYKAAQKIASATKRLIAHVAPENMRIRTRVFETAPGSGSFQWAVFAAQDEKGSKKGK